MKKHNNNIQTWCRLNKDVCIPTSYSSHYFGEYIPSDELNTFTKGTYIQVSKDNPSIYLDIEGDGFLIFNPEDLEEVYIDPCCQFSSRTGVLNDIRLRKNYPKWFNGNPEDWFSSDVHKEYQG